MSKKKTTKPEATTQAKGKKGKAKAESDQQAATPAVETPTIDAAATDATPAVEARAGSAEAETPAAEAPAAETPASEAATKKGKGKQEPAAKKPAKVKKMSCLDAAAKVLSDAGTAMTSGEMIEAMSKAKLWSSPNGQTPAATLYSAILREINTKGKDARFKKTERGKFTAK